MTKPQIKIKRKGILRKSYEIKASYPSFFVKGYGKTEEEAISDLLEALEFSLQTEEEE